MNKDESTDLKMLRSEEVQELMGMVPSWIMNWSITIIAIIIAGCVSGSYFFKYPETLTAEIMLFPTYDGTVPIGMARLPVNGAGKVKKGMQVIVTLKNYPETEFGYIAGVVENVAPIPHSDRTYPLRIIFPQGLKTSYGVDLPQDVQMIGIAEVIVKDKRLIENLLEPLYRFLRRRTAAPLHETGQ